MEKKTAAGLVMSKQDKVVESISAIDKLFLSRCLLSKTSLYISNITSEDEFIEMIKPYQPVEIIIKRQFEKVFAFLRVSTEDDARRAIEDLNNKQQNKNCLLVKFDNTTNGYSVGTRSVHKIKGGPQASLKNMQAPKVAEPIHCQTDLTDMPALIHVNKLGHNKDKYPPVDCSVYVANFPAYSLESSLRNIFAKYHFLDICFLNNGNCYGCTKAIVYLSTIYDAIRAVIEMDGSCDLGNPLTVEVPYRNTILTALVEKERMKMKEPKSPAHT